MSEEPQFLPLTHRHLKVAMPDSTTHDCWCDFTANEALLVQEIDDKPVTWEAIPIDETGPTDKKRFEKALWSIVYEPQRYKEEMLHSAGSIPGYPGSHGAGAVVLDQIERKVYTMQEWERMQKEAVAEEAVQEELATN